jgi:Protein of unknown function (DUF3011)
MFHHYHLHFPLWRLALLTLGFLSLALLLPRKAQPQGPRPGHVICSSNGGHVFCDADTAGGVSLERQTYGSNGCIKDQTWGYTDQGIWVDRGCSAEFALVGPEAAPNVFVSRVDPGTIVVVRTQEWVAVHRRQDRTYPATVAQDVVGDNGVVAIPRGSPVELMVRESPDHDLMLDLESVFVNGQRLVIPAGPGVGANAITGSGPTLGSIIGAIAGESQGGPIGPGQEILTRGPRVYVPSGSMLTFRLEQPLVVRAFPPRG